MPRFYFHTRHTDGTFERDEVGEVFVDKEAAKNEARSYAGEMLREAGMKRKAPDTSIEVTDAYGAIVLRFRCTDVHSVEKPEPR
jgi:hypothetical protein